MPVCLIRLRSGNETDPVPGIALATNHSLIPRSSLYPWNEGDLFYAMKSHYTLALPTAIIMQPDIVLDEGRPLELTCITTGAPPPTVIWSRDGMTFDPMDTRITISEESLQITNVIVQDTGTYYCTATSTTGTVATSTMVTVLDVPMENMLSPFIGRLGQTTELNCSSNLPPGESELFPVHSYIEDGFVQIDPTIV